MSSHQPTSSGSSAAHSYLLGSLQQSAPSPAITPSKARKQAQAQRTRLIALSKHLMTRLQYANFKVEHGWTKQSLSEVENLYYRHNEGGSAGAAARRSTSTSPNAVKNLATPSATTNSTTLGSRLFKDAAAAPKRADEEGDVFGGYGLATPPTSGGSVPGTHTSYLAQKRGRSASATPVSPPSATAGGAVKRSPNSGRSLQTKASMPSLQNANGASSYADFWSRVGSATTGPVSPKKKRNADNLDESLEVSAPAEDTAAAMSGPVSPKKRVRVEESGEHRTGGKTEHTSPAKAARH